MSQEFEAARDYKPEARDWLSSYWSGYNSPSQLSRIRNTGVPLDFLKEVRYTCVSAAKKRHLPVFCCRDACHCEQCKRQAVQ
jgi:hypothetical protein